MTPKEKAIQLINKFTYWNTSQAEREGILSALNVVDEVLFSNNTFFETNIPHECWKYWIEVKQEIINYKDNLI